MSPDYWGKLTRTAGRVSQVPSLLMTQRLDRMPGVHIVNVRPPADITLTNPTIARIGGRFTMLLREVAYEVNWRGQYTRPRRTSSPSSTWVADFDPSSGAVSDIRPVRIDSLPTGLGLEDPRLVGRDGDSAVLWAAVDENAETYSCQMAVAHLRGDEAHGLSLLNSPHQRRVEKNWMPYSIDGQLHVVYAPESLERYAIGRGALDRIQGPVVGHSALRAQSGSSQFIEWRGGWLGVTHSYVLLTLPPKLVARRFYRHHLVWVTEDFSRVLTSKPFVFMGRGIEFCAGIAATYSGVVATFGRNDRSAHAAVIDDGTLTQLLGAVAIEDALQSNSLHASYEHKPKEPT